MSVAVLLPFLLSLLLLRPAPSSCEYGGHDLFTSLAQLGELWRDEREVVREMRRAAETLGEMREVLERYVANHQALGLDGEPSFQYLGHPLNSYHLVRHVALGWQEVRESVFRAENETREIFDRLRSREDRPLPSVYDVEGAAYGLSRLHSLYGVDTAKMVEDGVIESNLQRHQVGAVVTSKPSVKKLEAWDLHMIATESWRNTLLNTVTDVLPYAISKLEEEEKEREEEVGAKTLELFMQAKPNRTMLEADLRKAIKMHDEMLIRRGPRGNHRCHEAPLDPKLRKKKKYRRPFRLDSPVRDEESVSLSRRQEVPEVNEKTQLQYQMLCSGEHFRPAREDADLRCAYASPPWSAWLRLAPIKLELRSRDPYLAVFRELMYPHECDNITAFLAPQLGFPPGRMSGRAAKNDWTMKNAWPVEDDNIYLEKMTRRVSHITRLLASSQLGQSDRFMCGNYGIGGHYGVHPDFYPYDESRFLSPGGNVNRVATVMTVLEAPEAGGATVWPYLGVSVFPEKGSSAMWFNVKSDAQVDDMTLHAACPVLLGQKWIGNKWIGYSPQFHGRPCTLRPHDRLVGFIPE